MKVSHKIISTLGELIAGDSGISPYLTGPKLVQFFNDCGFTDVYGEGFPTRWRYAAGNLEIANGNDMFKDILEEFVDPRRYNGDEKIVLNIVNEINELIKYDHYKLVKNGHLYEVVTTKTEIINPSSLKLINHQFINEQIKKCNDKIATNDYNGAITNARSLLEAVLIHCIEVLETTEIKNDGNLDNLWARCKKALKINHKKEELPEFVLQTLSGLDTIVKGLAGISNNAGDRHANKFNTRKHHAKLAVNSAMTITDYVVELMDLRKHV